jgi:hypothetical protein
MNKPDHLFATLIFVGLLTCISLSILLLNPPLRIMAKTPSVSTVVSNAIQSLHNSDIEKALADLNNVNNQLAVIDTISPDPQTLKLKSLVSNAIQSLHNSDIEKALADLNDVNNPLALADLNDVNNQLAATVLHIGSSNVSAIDNFSSYQNSSLGIRIQYPPDWVVRTGNNSVNLLAPHALLVLHVTRLPLKISQDEYSIAQINHDRENNKFFQNYSIAYSNTTTISNNPARFVLFTFIGHTPEQWHGWGMHVSTVLGNKGYDIEVIGSMYNFFHDIPTIQKVVNSLQIVNSTSLASGSSNSDPL